MRNADVKVTILYSSRFLAESYKEPYPINIRQKKNK